MQSDGGLYSRFDALDRTFILALHNSMVHSSKVDTWFVDQIDIITALLCRALPSLPPFTPARRVGGRPVSLQLR
jgi:hypothetical protein